MAKHHFHLTTSVAGRSLSYEAHFNLSGELQLVHSSFFDLPAAAQRLQSGDVPEFGRKVKNWGQLLQYAVLLALEDKLTIEIPGVVELAKNIHAANARQRTEWATVFKKAQLGETAAWYRYLSGQGQMLPVPEVHQPFHHRLNQLLATEKLVANQQYEAIRYFGYYGGIGGQNLLIEILPFLAHNARRLALEEFRREPTQRAKQVLLSEFTVANNEHFVSGILKGLTPHTEEEVIEVACRWFQFAKAPNEDALHNFAELLEQSSLKKVEPYLMKILNASKRYSAGRAALTLARIGADQDAILRSILPNLTSEDNQVAQGAFSILSALKDATMPSLQEMWNIFAKTTRRSPNLNIIYGFPSILKRMGHPDVQSLLEAGLRDESTNLRYASIILANCLILDKNTAFQPSDPVVISIFESQFASHSKEREEAVRVVPNFLPQVGYQKYIEKTIAAYTANPKATIYRLNILRAWGTLAERFGYDARTSAICHEAAANLQNYNFRVAAVQVLIHAKDADSKKLLARMQNDPSEDVRRRLQKKSPLVLGGMPLSDLQAMIKDEKLLSAFRKKLERDRLSKKVPPPKQLAVDEEKRPWYRRFFGHS